MSDVSAELLEILVCPRCRNSLAVDASSLRCDACQLRYEIVDGIPDMMVPHAAEPSESKPDAPLPQLQ
jgi:uncharacterized protein YbaR (Trm112 family)